MSKKKNNKMKKAYNKSTKKFNFKNPLLIAVIILVVAVGVFLIFRSFAASVVGAIEGEALTGSGSVIGDGTAGGMQALKLTGSTPASGTVNITATGDRLEVRARGDQCGGAPTMVVNVDGKDVMTANVTGTTWGPYGQSFNVAAGTHTVTVRMTNPYTGLKGKRAKNSCTRALYVDSIQFQDTTTVTPTPVDSTLPTVSINPPANNAILSSVASITANASDNVGVTKVELYIDTKLYGSVLTASPYKWTWDTTTVADGTHSLSAKAYDAAGNVGNSSTVTVNVNNAKTGLTNAERLGMAASWSGLNYGTYGESWLGLNVDRTRYFDTVKSTGAKWARGDANIYNVVYGRNYEGGYASLDSYLRGARDRGMKVMPTFTYGPYTDIAAWTGAVKGYIDHWKATDKSLNAPNGLLDTVGAYEIWNEPNNLAITQVPPAAYATLLKNVYSTIKANDPNKPVISGGMSPGGTNGACCTGNISTPAEYINNVYVANGGNSNGLFDAVGYHPYEDSDYSATSGNGNVAGGGFRATNFIRQVMNKYGDSGKKIWGTEAGLNSCAAYGGGSTRGMTEAERARRFTNDMYDWFYGVHDTSGARIGYAAQSDWGTEMYFLFKPFKSGSADDQLGVVYTGPNSPNGCNGPTNWYQPPMFGSIQNFAASLQSTIPTAPTP
jgi:hypothetical protein